MERFALYIIRLLKHPVRWCGADYEQVEAILKAKVAVDFRISSSIGHASGKPSSVFRDQLIIFMFVGAGISIGFIFFNNLFFLILNLFFSMIMVMLGLAVVADFSRVLFDHRDNQILLVRPISNKTLLITRLLHIQIYLGFLAMALGAFSSVFILIKNGILTFFIFLTAVELCAWITLILITFIYMVLSKVVSSERYKDIVLCLQIFMTIVLFGGYHLTFLLIDANALRDSIMEIHWWTYLIPPYWLAGLVGFVSGKVVSPENGKLALVALLVTIAGAIFLIRYFSGRFSDLLSQGAIEKAETEKKKVKEKSRFSLCSLLCVSEIERIGWKLTMTVTKRDRNFKLGVYPFYGVMIMMAIIIIRPDFTSLSATMEKLKDNSIFFFLLFLSSIGTFPIAGLPYTDTPEGAWIYKALPVKDHGHILTGAIKAIVLKIFSPVVFFLLIMTLVFWDASTLMGLVLGCLLIFLIIQYSIIIIKMPLPFTKARVMVQSGAFPKMIFFQMIFIGIAIGLIYLVMRLNIWISVIMCLAFFFMTVNANRQIRKKGFILE